MNTEQKTIEINVTFSDATRLQVESNRTTNNIEVSKYFDGDCECINLTHDQAYKLIDLIKTAMEVKL